MKQRKRISQLLMIIVLCIMIMYAGFHMRSDLFQADSIRSTGKMLTEYAGEFYLTGFFYAAENNHLLPKQWMEMQAMNLLPLGTYVENNRIREIQVEDEMTYEMILARQTEDENEVSAAGELVDKNNASASKAAEFVDKSKLGDFEYLISRFYTVDSSTSVNETTLNGTKMLEKDMTIKNTGEGPKILIYHTHSQEAFKDSIKGDTNTSIMGMGEYLAELLNTKYGLNTLHHEGVYDLINGKLDRSKAYQTAETQIKKILKENPSIEVVIDLHRDGVKESTHLVTEIEGKKTAQIMFFNGLSRTKANGDIAYLNNPYIEDNLAFSFQMQLAAAEKYPGFTRRIYLKSYRYNMHLMPKTLLIEAGAQTNTVEEMRNAMEYLAEILDNVLGG